MAKMLIFDVDGWDQDKIKKLQESLKENDPNSSPRTSVVVQNIDETKLGDLFFAGYEKGSSMCFHVFPI